MYQNHKSLELGIVAKRVDLVFFVLLCCVVLMLINKGDQTLLLQKHINSQESIMTEGSCENIHQITKIGVADITS